MIGNTAGHLQKHVFLRIPDDFRIMPPIIVEYDDQFCWMMLMWRSVQNDYLQQNQLCKKRPPSDGRGLPYDADE